MAKPRKLKRPGSEAPQAVQLAQANTSGRAPPGQDLLVRASAALARGNVRGARSLLRQVAASGPETDKAAALALIERLRPDPQSMMVAAAVLAVIWFAIWAGLLRGR